MFIKLTQWYPDGRTSPLLCNVKHINNVQERLNVPSGAAVMDKETKEFPKVTTGAAVTFQNSHAFVTQTVDEIYALIRNAELFGGQAVKQHDTVGELGG